MLQLAHQKYNSHDFSGALGILKELQKLAPSHLPTLLLLGCTCYSLGLYTLAIHYNNQILAVDSNFAEAYSNLGTTYRALAQTNQSLISPESGVATFVESNPPLTSNECVTLAEKYYRKAVSIRPRYWDASINLAGLLSSQGRALEALDVYMRIETIMEEVYTWDGCRMDKLRFDGNDELLWIQQIAECEANKKNYQNQMTLSNLALAPEILSFTVERRRDLYFSKGNIYYSLKDIQNAKIEYFKGLAAVGVILTNIYNNCAHTPGVPQPLTTPLSVWQKYIQKTEDVAHHPTTSTILQTLAKIYQDHGQATHAVALYYLSLELFPTANACNNLGIILSPYRLAESISWYELGLRLDQNHVHLFTNLGSALKDRGQVTEGITCYQKAISLQPDFFIALANLANVFKDLGRVEEAIELYRRALKVKPDFVEAYCNFVSSLLFVCEWSEAGIHMQKLREIVVKQLNDHPMTKPRPVPTVLPFHTFTYSSLSAWMVREISRRNAEKALWNVLASDWFAGFPQRPAELILQAQRSHATLDVIQMQRALCYPYPYPVPLADTPMIKIGYLSSDFNNHPLAHLMQSVFGMHDRSKFMVFCYSLSPSDDSPYRAKIERGSDVFVDVNNWSNADIISRIISDGIHVLVNLNGYTKGGRNEIFAARPAPLHFCFMGFAGTMGAGSVYDPDNSDFVAGEDVYVSSDIQGQSEEFEKIDFFDDLKHRWMDYFVVDEIACPKYLVCGEPIEKDEDLGSCHKVSANMRGPVNTENDQNRMYTEGLVFMPHSFFVNDHRQGFREEDDPEVERMVHANRVDLHIPERTTDSLTTEEKLRWRTEEIRRLKMRHEIFPWLREDTVIYANFNQLYKVLIPSSYEKLDPQIFEVWMNILKRVPNSILWLLRFPPAGEQHLRKRAVELVGADVASRLIFTGNLSKILMEDVAPKHVHIHRGRIADMFLDTPECNAHTTAADILWSGTPIITYPKYDFKLCSRVAASCAYATGTWDEGRSQSMYQGKLPGLNLPLDRLKDDSLVGHHMVVNSYKEYEERAVMFGLDMKWSWKSIGELKENYVDQRELMKENIIQYNSLSPSSFYPSKMNATHIYTPDGLIVRIRRQIFLNRDILPLFNTNDWVKNLEKGIILAFDKWKRDYAKLQARNQREISVLTHSATIGVITRPRKPPTETRCFWL